MNRILINGESKSFADGSFVGNRRVGCSHGFTVKFNGIVGFENLYNDRSGSHKLDQTGKEGFVFVFGIKFFRLDFGGKMQFDKSSKKSENKNWERDIFISAANFKYPTVKTKELKKIPIQDICADNCLLFMWVTNPHLAQGIELGQAWGFEYKTVGFVWDKCNHNPGQYTLSNCELCLIFKKGKIPTPRGARNVQQLVRVPRTEHSVKPIEVLHNIEKMFPTQEKIELFARHKPEGWTVWGLDVRPVYKE